MSRWPTLRPPDHGDAGSADGRAPKLRPRELASAARRSASPSWIGRLRQPLPLLGVVLVLIALIGYLAVYSAANNRTAILVLTRPLPAGSTLQAADLQSERLAAPASVLAALEPAADLRQALGRRLQSAGSVGEPLTRAAVTAQSTQPSAFTLDVPAATTAGEDLAAGDHVTVLATFGTGTGQVASRVLARDLEVLSVGPPPTDANLTSTTVPVTVALTDISVSTQLALANEDGKIDLLRDGANTATAAIPQATERDTTSAAGS